MERLADLFYEASEKYPQKEAIWCDGRTIMYQELANVVSQYSNLLLFYGVKYGDHIGIPMNNSIESVALMLAAANLGAAIVPVSPTLPVHAVRTAFLCGSVKHIIARKSFFEELDRKGGVDVAGIKVCMDAICDGTIPLQESEKFGTERPMVEEMTGGEMFVITLTSGSTGSPKPISLTQNNKYKRAFAHIQMYGLTSEDRILAATPLYHSLAERLVLMPLLTGATSILLPRFTPELWLNCVKEQKVTFTIAVSAQLGQIAELLSALQASEIPNLRCIVSSSALLKPHIKKILIDSLACEFHEMYGTSETSTVTDIHFRETEGKQNSVGRPIAGAEIMILSENGEIEKPGVIGEIVCRTELMCSGYYNMPQEFERALWNGYFRTGDLGYLDKDGFLYFSGRKKELIITGGINVYPPDLESCISQIPEVKECAAFAYPDERLGEVVAVAIVIKEGLSLRKRTVQIHCARQLADYQQPYKIFFVRELPKNAMGKLVKTALVEYVSKEENINE